MINSAERKAHQRANIIIKQPQNLNRDMPEEKEEVSAMEEAWETYHGPTVNMDEGDDYMPAAPPAYMRGFADGIEYSMLKMQNAKVWLN